MKHVINILINNRLGSLTNNVQTDNRLGSLTSVFEKYRRIHLL